MNTPRETNTPHQQETPQTGSRQHPDRRAWAGLWVLAAALGMIVLDGTIVSVALPSIVTGLHLDLVDVQWVTSLYNVVFAALLLTMGRAGDRTGRRRVLLVGLTAFVAGSVLAALSGSLAGLLLARTIQGIGGAMILPATLSTVNATFRGRDRAAAFGVWGAVMSGAAALGPLLGGWLTQAASWRWIFWVNVPVGIVLALLALRLVDETRSDQAGGGMDWLGTALSATGFGAIVFGLIEGGTIGWWRPTAPFHAAGMTWAVTRPVSLALLTLVAGGVLLACFVVVESSRGRAGRGAVLDLSLFRVQSFTLGNSTAGLVAVGEFALLFVLPLYLVTSLHLSTLRSGLVLSSMAMGAFLSGAAARHLAQRLGAPKVVVLGLALEITGAAATACAVAGQWNGWAVAGCLLPYGLGLGLASAQLTSTTLHDVPADESGAGSATQSTVRQLGSALGSATGGAVLTHLLGHTSLDPRTTSTSFAHAASGAVWAAAAILLLGLALAAGLAVTQGGNHAA